MTKQVLVPALLVGCLALFAGGLAAQTPSAQTAAVSGDSGAKSDSQTSSSLPQSSAQQQPSTHSKHAKAKKSSHHTAKTTSTQHVAKTKSTQGTARTKTKAEESAMPDESAYRQALRGCVTQKDESQRDNCIDQTIQRFGRNA